MIRIAAVRNAFRKLGSSIIIILMVVVFFAPKKTSAAITQTTVSVAPTSVTRDTEETFIFTINNTDTASIRYIKITRPYDAITITGGAKGWVFSVTSSYIIITGGVLPGGTSDTFALTAVSGSSDHASADWIVEVSDAENGANAFRATGSVPLTISGAAPDMNPPVISGVSVSHTTTSFTCTWNTSKPATEQIDYGTTNGYGSTQQDASFVSSHTMTISNLSAGTTYYFQIGGMDDLGNSADQYSGTVQTTAANTVAPTATPTPGPSSTPSPTLTPSPVPTSTPVPTLRPTPTRKPTPIPTPTPIPDRTPPVISLTPLPGSIFRFPPQIQFSVSDEHDIALYGYSINGGKTIELEQTSGSKKSFTSLFIHEGVGTSGTYEIRLLATDTEKNTAISPPVSFSIDNASPVFSGLPILPKMGREAPHLSGSVEDSSPLSSVQISYDHAKTWEPMIEHAASRIRFNTEFHDPKREGVYDVMFRARDAVGNETTTIPQHIVIDRLPPNIGGIIAKIHSFIRTPTSVHLIESVEGFPITFFFSTVGGVTSGFLTLTSETKTITMPLVQSFRAGIWETTMIPDRSGTYMATLTLDDSANPPVKEKSFLLRVNAPVCQKTLPSMRSDTSVTIEAFDPATQEFFPWSAMQYGQKNTTAVLIDHCRPFFVPPGTYRLKSTSRTAMPIQTEPFSLSTDTFLSTALTYKQKRCTKIGVFSFCLPETDYQKYQPTKTNIPEEALIYPKNALSILDISALQEFATGTPIVMLVTNTWHPYVFEQIDALARYTKNTHDRGIVLIPNEGNVTVEAWKKQSAVTLPMIADPDGEIMTKLGFHLIPGYVRISNAGIVTHIANMPVETP
jgi:hypothetical protein